MEDPAKHLGLVARIAMRFTSERPVENSDEFGDGCMGMWVACLRFDATRGYKFSTFGWYYIAGFIRSGKRNRRPAGCRGVGTAPPLPPQPITEELEALLIDGEEEKQSTIKPADVIDELLLTIPERERFVLLEHAGGRTLQEIGTVLGVGRERVRQYEATAFARLRGEKLPKFSKNRRGRKCVA